MATEIRMEHAVTQADQQVVNSSQNRTNLIEWNVDMRVTVSNVKTSKMFQRSRNIVIFLLAIVFAVVVSHIRREVHALQVQIQYMNVNILVLMSKYDRLNRSLNRARIQGADKYYENKNMRDIMRFLETYPSSSKTVEILGDISNNENSYAYSSIMTLSSPVDSTNEKFVISSDTSSTNERSVPMKVESLTKVETAGTADDKAENNLRIERAILAFEKENSTATGARSDRERNVRYGSDDADDYYNDDDGDDLDVWKEPRSGRSRRDGGRGKKRGKNKRRPKRSRRRLGPLVATFVGAIPEQHVTDTVYVGPWVRSTKNDSQYSLNKFHLVEDKKSIEVTTSGLYMISAQIFYFGEPTNYSYWILLSSEGKSATQRLVKCSTASSTSAAEVSCYTSVITSLRRGDRLHIQQQERDRLINMREGHSYIQLVLLSNNTHKRRMA